MHPSAYKFGELFLNCYYKNGMKVAEIGSQNVNGSLKDFLPAGAEYLGVDFVEGKGVDIVLDDPYRLPFEDNSFDMVISSSCFEHSNFFWLSFLEVARILKPSGLFYLNVPSNGWVHRYPVDCWRFYPDSGSALALWGQRNGFDMTLIESFVGEQLSVEDQGTFGAGSERWNDFVAVFVKGGEYLPSFQKRMNQDNAIKFTNLVTEESIIKDHVVPLPNDFRKQNHLSEKVGQLEKSVTDQKNNLTQSFLEKEGVLNATIKELSDKNKKFAQVIIEGTQQNEHLNNKLRKIKNEVQALNNSNKEILNSLSWKITKPLRVIWGIFRK
jgi:SAM-dependent methyltransferase